MTGVCATFLQHNFGGNYYAVREKNVFNGRWHYFDTYKDTYDALSQEDKEIFLIYAYAVSAVRDFFLDKKKAAQKDLSGAAESFENRVAIGTLELILDQWKALWDKEGCMKCEVGK